MEIGWTSASIDSSGTYKWDQITNNRMRGVIWRGKANFKAKAEKCDFSHTSSIHKASIISGRIRMATLAKGYDRRSC